MNVNNLYGINMWQYCEVRTTVLQLTYKDYIKEGL